MASAISSVLTNLSPTILQEYQSLRTLRVEIRIIKDDFHQMMNFLEGADLLLEDNPHLRSWVDLVRDCAYEVEDALDEFEMHRTYRVAYNLEDVLDESVMQCSFRHSTIVFNVFKKLYTNSVGATVAEYQLATRIKEIKKRMQGISDSHRSYKTLYRYLLPERASSSSSSKLPNMKRDKRGDALFLEETDLVGIEGPKRYLTDLLLNGDARRNVIYIVGMGGLGKTTLAKKVYDDVFVRGRFNHHAWITVSESFKLEALFKDAIKQLFNEERRQVPHDVDSMDINRLKLVVKDFLRTKKYIVVFDDVWNIDHWEDIHLAFPKNKFGSRIVTTTRNNELGQAASMTEAGGSVYLLRPLENKQAMQLLCKKAFAGAISCPRHLEEICEKIMLACGGLPLAIEVIGSVLARRRHLEEEWELFYKSLSAGMHHNSQLYRMMRLLSLSYYDLPKRLKICFLYLSIFPEDAKVSKEDIAQLWIAEGFVEKIIGMTMEEVAYGYLNELVDRCLLQVAAVGLQGILKSIRIHDILRKIAIHKADEQNIVNIFRGEEGMSFQNNFRRLSIHGLFSGNFKQAQNYCKSIRSVVLFNNVGHKITEPFLSNLLSHGRKFVKVLYLIDAELDQIPDEVFKLFHLRYLNLRNTYVRSLPKSIGMLQSLQTLNLLGTRVTELPVEIQKLQHLRQLIMGCVFPKAYLEKFEQVQGVEAPFRIGNLTSLQQLKYIDADQVDNISIVREIGKLIQLRTLGITKLKREDGNELCSSLGNLTELRQLYVYSENEEVIDFQNFRSSNLPRLQTLILTGRLENSLEWISPLHGLTRIDLQCSQLRDDPMECLQDLPTLFNLYLSLAYQGESLCFKSGKFARLQNLHLKFLGELKSVTVEENAMPFLRTMLIRDCPSMEEIPKGIENLMRVKHLEFSNMCNVFVNKLENLPKESAIYRRLLQIPKVSTATWTENGFSGVRHLNKISGTFNNQVP